MSCSRILALDGGGVRGLSSLLILRELMGEIGRQKNLDQTPLPCEFFDLIGGTGTGGLIAIMLGRLRMVASCGCQVNFSPSIGVSMPMYVLRKTYSKLIKFFTVSFPRVMINVASITVFLRQ